MSKYKHSRIASQAGLIAFVFLPLIFFVSLPARAQQGDSLTFREFCALLPDAPDATVGDQISEQKSHYCKNYEQAGGAGINLLPSPEEAHEWVMTPVTGVATSIAGQYRPNNSYGDGTGLQM